MKKIILIGGAPTTGKSTIASKLSKHLGLPWISTDQIRDVMQFVADREKFTDIFPPKGYDTAEEFLNKFDAEKIVEMEFKQGRAVWPTVKHFIENDSTWYEGFIIEGINLLPEFVSKKIQVEAEVKSIFIYDDNMDRIRDVVYTRGLWDNADSYSDDVKEKEVEWTIRFIEKLKEESAQYDMACIKIEKNESDLQRVLEALSL